MSITTKIETTFTHHPSVETELRIGPDKKLAVAIEPAIITVGIQNQDKEEIIQREDGTYIRRVAVESKEVYNKKTQKKRNWFVVALETGQNPRRYFPGAEIHGLISGNSAIPVYSQSDSSSQIVGTIEPNTWVIIKNILNLSEQPDYYKIATSNSNNALVGYIAKTAIIADRHKVYEAPFK